MNAEFFDLQKQNRSFASLVLFGPAKFNVAADGRTDALGGARVTGSFFETMGVAPETVGSGIRQKPLWKSAYKPLRMSDPIQAVEPSQKQVVLAQFHLSGKTRLIGLTYSTRVCLLFYNKSESHEGLSPKRPPQSPAATFNRLYPTRAERPAHIHARVKTRIR